MHTCYRYEGPAAVRYPRGSGVGALIEHELTELTIGQSISVRDGAGVAILSFGTLLSDALAAADSINATVVDMRWVKPIDEAR